jgi:high-affinity iron transporter
MVSSFVITLREGIEAALVVGLVLAAIRKAGAAGMARSVWYGVAVAVVASAVAGAALVATIGSLPEDAAAIVEGIAGLVAVGVLTFMVFWMRVQGSRLGAELDSKAAAAVAVGSGWALGLLAFSAVAREGLETALFLVAAAGTTGAAATLVGGVGGLAVAVALGYALYQGSLNLDIRAFFRVTGGLIILLAAGMLAYSIHELQEAGVVPIVVEHLWDTNALLDEKVGVGAFLKALVGYNGNPSLLEVVAYWTYLSVVGWLFLRPQSRRVATSGKRPAVGAAH